MPKVGAGDKLFGSINNGDLAQEFSQSGSRYSIRNLFLSAGNTLKRAGKYNASIRLHREVIVDFPFEIVAEVAKVEAKPAEKAEEPKAEIATEQPAGN